MVQSTSSLVRELISPQFGLSSNRPITPQIASSAVTETVPEPETAVFRQNRAELKPRFFGAK